MEIISGKIINLDQYGLTIQADYKNHDRACLRRYSKVEVALPDGRNISPAQRRKAYALIHEISDFTGELPEMEKERLKLDFVVNHLQALAKKMFSLSNCDMTTAREFISYLIDFMIEHDIPSKTPLVELCEDITRYVYACTKKKICAVCGRPAELHHVDRIGMGRNRQEVYQIGMLVLPLCRQHHTECHTMPQNEFNKKYHLQGIKLTKEIAKQYHLT